MGGCVPPAPVMYVAPHAALVFIIYTSLYLYTTHLLVAEVIPASAAGGWATTPQALAAM